MTDQPSLAVLTDAWSNATIAVRNAEEELRVARSAEVRAQTALSEARKIERDAFAALMKVRGREALAVESAR